VPPPLFHPAELVRRRAPFDDEQFIFELKHDGFRSLAYIESGQCRLVSRRCNVYKSFRSLSSSLSSLTCESVLDGEIVSLDADGRPQFYDLLRHRGEPIFYAFDCLWHDGNDLRLLPWIKRKRVLKHLVEGHPSILLAQHIESFGCEFFDQVCRQDLEGIVAKRRDGAYGVDWFKIRNPNYSQYEGRHELFEKRLSRAAT
jgi:bifunctional non-homologous end joining protein LigD